MVFAKDCLQRRGIKRVIFVGDSVSLQVFSAMDCREKKVAAEAVKKAKPVSTEGMNATAIARLERIAAGRRHLFVREWGDFHFATKCVARFYESAGEESDGSGDGVQLGWVAGPHWPMGVWWFLCFSPL
jgi:hypothetical protein